ncbi:A24 family peptidase [Nitrosomonas ureae]|uniref:A24 family peptidase n=1 Tax=Nitrosomonas ureae TaxID=44577 RepID=UPI0021563F00|nr:prepilin peptidase [Nitrosomonas ureae]
MLLLLSVAAWQDFRSYRISNTLVFSGALLGVLLNTFLPVGIGFTESLMGWGIGLLLLLPLYLLRMMGAGDVKLMAMVGAFVGTNDIISVFLYTLIAGGIIALVVALQRGVLRRLMDNFIFMFLSVLSVNKSKPSKDNLSVLEEAPDSVGKLPYGIAIAVGTITSLAINHSTLMID